MELKKMQEEFNEMKKTNAIMIKQAIAKAFKDEQEAQQKILREKGRLDKVGALLLVMIYVADCV